MCGHDASFAPMRPGYGSLALGKPDALCVNVKVERAAVVVGPITKRARLWLPAVAGRRHGREGEG